MRNSKFAHAALLTLVSIAAVAGDLQSAAPPSNATGSEALAGWHRHGGGMDEAAFGSGLVRVLRRLNLTDAQKAQVHNILKTAHDQSKADLKGEIADLPAFGNPGDPQYAAAVQAAQARATQRIQRWSATQQQVYAVLTPPQQAQLPQLLTALQQRMSAHGDRGAAPKS